jgi:hypothetical protein
MNRIGRRMIFAMLLIVRWRSSGTFWAVARRNVPDLTLATKY